MSFEEVCGDCKFYEEKTKYGYIKSLFLRIFRYMDK